VERFIGAMACADLFLDTPDFNAGAVGALALNAGLPLLTCAGQTFKARMGASLCNAANIQELVTSDLISYTQRAIELGQNPENLQQIKNKLKHKAIDLPLFQQQQWVYNLCNLIRIKS
jgi:predicted O-linked N-acetylglucosamine transferase (SPINDLY family)